LRKKTASTSALTAGSGTGAAWQRDQADNELAEDPKDTTMPFRVAVGLFASD
jgi:hypothetical protein